MMGAPDNPGIIPRLCNALFDRIRRLRETDPSLTCKVFPFRLNFSLHLR